MYFEYDESDFVDIKWIRCLKENVFGQKPVKKDAEGKES